MKTRKPGFHADDEDTSGVFRRLIDDSANINAIANAAFRAAVSGGADKRIVLVTEDVDRATELRKLLVARRVSESIGIAVSLMIAEDMFRERNPMLVVVSPELASECRSLLYDLDLDLTTSVYVLNGDDTKTAEQIKKEDQ